MAYEKKEEVYHEIKKTEHMKIRHCVKTMV